MLLFGGFGRVDYGALKIFQSSGRVTTTDPVLRVPMHGLLYFFFFPSRAIGQPRPSFGNRPMPFRAPCDEARRFLHGPGSGVKLRRRRRPTGGDCVRTTHPGRDCNWAICTDRNVRTARRVVR